MVRDEAPEGNVEVWPKLIDYALKHGLEIDTVYSKKVDWMEKHKGVCYCSQNSGRICPCTHISADIKRYNGQCLCGLLLTPEKHKVKIKYDEKKKEKARLAKVLAETIEDYYKYLSDGEGG